MRKIPTPQETFQSGLDELRKRRKETAIVLGLALAFILLTWAEFRLLSFSKQLPFVYSIFFFGLVNFNIILLLLLFFFIFRNVVKVFVEKRSRIIGSSLKAKLIAAFVAFATVPTALMFLVSVFYINNSFDKWFSIKMAGVLKNSLEVNQEYVFSAKRKNYHFALQIVGSTDFKASPKAIESQLERWRERFSLDAVEFYPGLFAQRILAVSKDEAIPKIPAVSLEFLKKGITNAGEASAIQHFGEGNLIRVILPVSKSGEHGALVVSTFIPLSLISKMEDISAAHEELRNVNPLQYPLKSIYLIILVMMTLVILLCATWFGFYLARQLSIPLEVLGLATQKVAQGEYETVAVTSGSEEINQLIMNFNQMTVTLEKSEKQVKQANASLRETLERLDEHSRYIQVVLSNVSTGVVSVDENGLITTFNRHAGQLLKVEPEGLIGQPVKKILSEKYFSIFSELLKKMKQHGAVTIQQEVRLDVGDQSIPFQMNLSLLTDERGHDLGKVLVFDDLTPMLNAQRAAAWTEVARRIAHEIKNPLTPIKLSAERLEKKFGGEIKDPAFSSCIKMIISQTDDLKNLVNEFSNFARLPQSNPVLADLNNVIRDVMVLFETGHKDVRFDMQLDSKLPEFKFDPEQIKRVLINLVDNAVAATHSVTERAVVLKTSYDSTLRLVRLIVSDNGVGIPDSNRVQIFEPYFSTKEEGTGLGLAIVKRIVEDHNGFVRAFGNEPRGTKIVIELPVNFSDNRLVLQAVDKGKEADEQNNS